MMRLNKKGISPIGILGEILIVLVVIVILLAIVIVPRLTTQSDIVGVQIGGIQGDADKDSTRNFFDKCPCTFGEIAYDGCPVTFTDEQKKEDVQKYNSEPVCWIRIGETVPGIISDTPEEKEAAKKAAEQKPAEQKSEPAAFKQYQSIEIFGDDDWSSDKLSGEIYSVCTGWVGQNCPAADKSCDASDYSREQLTESCWIMASEDDGTVNECGQAKADHGTVISSKEYKDLDIDNYFSAVNDGDPQNLFSWKWKSQSKFGSLICNKGSWYRCLENNEGRTLDVAGKTYTCTGSEWS